PAHRHDFEVVLHVLGDLLEVLDVFLGDQHRLDAATVGRQQLFLQAADGGDLTAQGDLTGHRHIGTHRNPGQGRHEGRGHRRAGTGAILGRGTVGYVDVDVTLLEQLVLDAQAPRTVAHDRP